MYKTTIAVLTALGMIASTISADTAQDKKAASAIDLLPEKLVNADGKEVSRDTLKGKTIAFYFSAAF